MITGCLLNPVVIYLNLLVADHVDSLIFESVLFDFGYSIYIPRKKKKIVIGVQEP